MEEISSGNDRPLLAKLRALARRHALLRRQGDGAGVVVEGERNLAAMTPQDFLHAIDRGWLNESGAEAFVLSKRGASMLRAELNRTAVTRASERPAPTATPQPVILSKPQIDHAESPLAWLRQQKDVKGRPLISETDFEAGERLRADFETARMTPRITASWDMTLPGRRQQRGPGAAALTVSEAAMAAHQRFERALRAVGPKHASVLIDVCCLLLGMEQLERNGHMPRRSGKVALQYALESLACHYGMIAPADDGRPSRVRHWGADGYRPTVVGGGEEPPGDGAG